MTDLKIKIWLSFFIIYLKKYKIFFIGKKILWLHFCTKYAIIE